MASFIDHLDKDKITTYMNLPIDHLIYAAPALESGIDAIEALLGVRPVYGGQHPGRGTHNALLGLGSEVYLEVIAPDPDQPDVPRPLWIPADRVAEPRLIYWAAKSNDLAALVEKAGRSGLKLGEVSSGSRARPDGQLLSWQLTGPRANPADGIIPFFIDWGDSPHPALGLPQGGKLVALQARHPAPGKVSAWMQMLGLDMKVEYGPEPALSARIQAPEGVVVLA